MANKTKELKKMHSRTNKDKHDGKEKQSEYKPLKTGRLTLDLREDWLELISRYEYDLFVTLTFREDTERWLAEERFDKWIAALNIDLFGGRYKQRGRGIRYAVVYGNQKRGTLHFHALLGAKGLKELDREYMAELWKCNGQKNKKTGTLLNRIVNGHADIKIYDPEKGAKHYLTNHIFLGGEPDIFVPRKERDGQVP